MSKSRRVNHTAAGGKEMASEVRSSNAYTRLLLGVVIVLGFQIPVLAQSSGAAARPDRGVRPNGSYAISDIENISMTNGNLNVSIPLAGLPAISGGRLSLAVGLNYNSKLWDIKRDEFLTDVSPGVRYNKDIIQGSDLGGWRIGAGYSIVFQSPATYDFGWLGPDLEDNDYLVFAQKPYNFYVKVLLITPDGATHELRPLDFAPYQNLRDFLWSYYWETPDKIGAPMRYYSFDGSYIWAEINPSSSNIKWRVYLPDGARIRQRAGQEIEDPNGNIIRITTEETSPGVFVTHYQDLAATGPTREILISGDANPNQQIQYQTIDGTLATIDVLWGSTRVQGKTYEVNDHFPGTNSVCTRVSRFDSFPMAMVREITFPQTEPGQPRKKFTFTYNSDSTCPEPCIQQWEPACGATPVQINSSTRGWGELSQMVLPSGAIVNYSYNLDSVHRLTSDNGFENNDLPRAKIVTKVVSHDGGTTDTWSYDSGALGGSVIGPDGSSTTQRTYATDPAFSMLYGGPGLGSLSYKTEQRLNGVLNVTTERHWTRFRFNGGADIQPGTLHVAPFNALVDAEYTTLHNAAGVAAKMNAKTYQHDYNGNVTEIREYDWFDPNSVTREGGGVNLPIGPPASAILLRVTTSSYHSQADGAASTNVYAKRVSGNPPSPFILNAVKETTVGNGTTVLSTNRVHYDTQGFNTLPIAANVTKERRDNSGVWIDVNHTYDVQGNRLTTTDANGNVTTFVYGDDTHAQPTSITVDPNNQVPNNEFTTLITYDYYTGLVKTQTDPNGNTATTDYTNQRLNAVDPFGRPGKVTGPDVSVDINGQVSTQRRTAVTKYFDNALQVETISDLNAETDGKLRNRTTVDQLGRAIKSEHSEDGSTYSISSETIYKNKPGGQNGSATFTRNPHRSVSDSTDGWTQATQDVMGRTTEVATFAGPAQPPDTGTTGAGVTWSGSVTTNYNVEQTTVTDQAGKARKSIIDGLGRLKQVIEDPSGAAYVTTYGYDVLGDLTSVAQGAQTRTFIYDSLSRLREAYNPEQVNTSNQQMQTVYLYDDASNLTRKTNPSGTYVSFTYDGLNRVKTKTLSTGGVWNYNYDTATNGKGRLTSLVLQGGTDGNYYDGYDAVGKITGSHQITTAQSGAQSYSFTYGYNLAGGMTKDVYPSGREIRTNYDDAGRVAGVKNQASGLYYAGAPSSDSANRIQYTAHGAMNAMKLGNGKWEHTSFNARLQPTQIGLGTSSDSSVLRLDYTYGTTNNNGNVQSQAIVAPTTTGGTATISQTYQYDPLNRLSSATESGGWTQIYDCDRYGNRAVRNTTYIPNLQLTPQSSSPTDFSAFNQNTNRLVASVYDTSGNQTQDAASRSFTYDAENHQVTFNTTAGTYSYDGDGRRVKKTDSSGTTVFVYNAGGQLIAEYTSVDPVSTNGLSYLTSDHLGSTRLVTDINGNVKSRHDYLPFGEELASSVGSRGSVAGYGAVDGVRQKFTQKQRDNESGLDYFEARYFSPAQARFASVDPENGGSRRPDPQSWNGFAYARNNPLSFIDPDGQEYLIISSQGFGKVSDATFYEQRKYYQALGFTFTGSGNFYESGTIISPDGQPVASYTQLSIDDQQRRFAFEMSRRTTASYQAIGAFAAITYGTGAAIGAGVFYGPAAAELLRRTVPKLLRAGPKVDPNKLNHIFGKAQHNLANLVRQFGSQEKAFNAIQKATQAVVDNKGLQGVFEETVKVGTETITVRGNIVDGIVRIGTAFKP